jgi:hypothetical protein
MRVSLPPVRMGCLCLCEIVLTTLVAAITKVGGHPRFESLDGQDYFILDIYDRADLYEWLLQQKRGKNRF